MENVLKLIQDRRSVRTFRAQPLSESDVQEVRECLHTLNNPFGVSVTTEYINAKDCGGGSPVIVGADEYVGFKAAREGQFELAVGYEIEDFCLQMEALGIGTVILAATIKRSAFERAMDVGPNEVMPVVTPVGYPAAKRSLRETMMRKGLRADDRLPFKDLFFRDDFGNPMSPDEAGPFKTALEMMRLAPSATNKQPWRAVVDGDVAYIYEKQTIPTSSLGDIQKVDVGIGICNFLLALGAEKKECALSFEDPGLPDQSSMQYIATCSLR